MVSRKERLAICFNLIGKEFKKGTCNGDTYPKEFSIKDITIFDTLSESPKMMSELAEELNLTPGTMTTKIDNLIKKKFVERSFDTEDRRKVYIQLTQKGKNISDEIMNKNLEMAGILLKKLDPSEQETYVKLTEKLVTF